MLRNLLFAAVAIVATFASGAVVAGPVPFCFWQEIAQITGDAQCRCAEVGNGVGATFTAPQTFDSTTANQSETSSFGDAWGFMSIAIASTNGPLSAKPSQAKPRHATSRRISAINFGASDNWTLTTDIEPKGFGCQLDLEGDFGCAALIDQCFGLKHSIVGPPIFWRGV